MIELKEPKHECIYRKCKRQNEIFKNWDQHRQWRQFHHAHYDWWAFPIDQNSSYGDLYNVKGQTFIKLQQMEGFLNLLISNAILVCKAWGYDLQKEIFLESQDPYDKKWQKWQNWPIRLYKMTKSLWIFNQKPYFEMVCRYGKKLVAKGFNFQYKHRKLDSIFNYQKPNKVLYKEKEVEKIQGQAKKQQNHNQKYPTRKQIQEKPQKLHNNQIKQLNKYKFNMKSPFQIISQPINQQRRKRYNNNLPQNSRNINRKEFKSYNKPMNVADALIYRRINDRYY